MLLYTAGGRARTRKSDELKLFESYVELIARTQMQLKCLPVFQKPVKMHLEVVFGDRRKRDLQNCFGSVCDALNGVVYEDDCQIVYLSASKRVERKQWGFTITVEEIEEEERVAK
jgi:Holliday junction resolvase RusA-like endonuclease